jgi:hypothetical protein
LGASLVVMPHEKKNLLGLTFCIRQVMVELKTGMIKLIDFGTARDLLDYDDDAVADGDKPTENEPRQISKGRRRTHFVGTRYVRVVFLFSKVNTRTASSCRQKPSTAVPRTFAAISGPTGGTFTFNICRLLYCVMSDVIGFRMSFDVALCHAMVVSIFVCDVRLCCFALFCFHLMSSCVNWFSGNELLSFGVFLTSHYICLRMSCQLTFEHAIECQNACHVV